MWLVNTSTITLSEFASLHETPPYAILSHRWGSLQDEMSHRDMLKGKKLNSKGHKKIREACYVARMWGLEWLWADTCCIDKTSSAELSEAVNSMFGWYENAEVCYAYLQDAGFSEGDWKRSEWWQRGWTLQELLAPRRLQFFGHDWHTLGNRENLQMEISALTKIPADVFGYRGKYLGCCVAQRMSWAANRQTTRVEDQAYCLLGLFRINMPLLYGEGTRAFRRLQLEIVQKYPDESIFAWRMKSTMPHSILAKNPAYFESCAQMLPYGARHGVYLGRETPARVTNWGIEIQANAKRLYPLSDTASEDESRLIWALTLAITSRAVISLLPCTIVLVSGGPCHVGYRRVECLQCDPTEAETRLKEQFRIGGEEKVVFFLQFDDDLESRSVLRH